MPIPSETGHLEDCRHYLRVLARQAMKSSLRTKVDESDVAQEVLVQAHRALDQFRGNTRGELLAWLREILKKNYATRRARTIERNATSNANSRSIQRSSIHQRGWKVALRVLALLQLHRP